VASGDCDAMEDELGDLLFVATNLARQLNIDPGTALRRGNAKFERRFRAMEDAVGGHDGLESMGLEKMESLWQQVKKNTEKERS
jgi:ATP diphosphatase